MNNLEISAFCDHTSVDKSSHSLELIWAEPRDIAKLIITFSHELTNQMKSLDLIQDVSYWRSTWPKNRPDTAIKQGSGPSGWHRQDDWYSGMWQSADIQIHENKKQLEIEFRDLIENEVPEESFHTFIRRTLKLRLKFHPKIDFTHILKIEVFSESQISPNPAKFQIIGEPSIYDPINCEFNLNIFNGFFVDLEENTSTNQDYIEKLHFNQFYQIQYTIPSHINSNDGTIVTVSPKSKLNPQNSATSAQKYRAFSFLIQDLLNKKRIFIPDLGILITSNDDPKEFTTLKTIFKEKGNLGGETLAKEQFSINSKYPLLNEQSIYDRIFQVSERRFSDAMDDFKIKRPLYAVIGCEGTRSKAAILINGEMCVSRQFISRAPADDSQRVFWSKMFSSVQFEWLIDGHPLSKNTLSKPFKRSRFKDYLPAYSTTWKDERSGILISHFVFATELTGTIPENEPNALAEVVGMHQFHISNPTTLPHDIQCRVGLGHRDSLISDEVPIALYDSIQIQSDHPEEYIIKFFDSKQRIPSYLYEIENNSLTETIIIDKISSGSWRQTTTLMVQPKQDRIIKIKTPLLGLQKKNEIKDESRIQKLLHNLNWDSELRNMEKYWETRLKIGAKIAVPNSEFTAFYKAQLIHILITNDRSIEGYAINGRVGGMGYGNYPNEVCMIVQELHRRGYYSEARRILETYFIYQSTVGLNGAYEDLEGIFFGSGGYQSGEGYNQNQGWVLWAIIEHYRATHDKEYLQNHLEGIIKACQWIINERHHYMEYLTIRKKNEWNQLSLHHQALCYGLLPPGGVEDLNDYWFWLSTNAYNSYGLTQAATALGEINHSLAQKFCREAEDYMRTVRTIFNHASEQSPVVLLHNGTFQPHIPCRAERRGRGYGWIQETLEGAIHLIRCEIFSPFSQEATWIIKDLEDNCYLSEGFGYPYIEEDFEEKWFCYGGFSQQPFLLCNHLIYAIRNEPKHFLRAVFNAFAVNYRPDTKMFTEHPLPTFYDIWGHFPKTSDESQFCGCLRTMLVYETYSKIEEKLSFSDSIPTQFPFAENIRESFSIPNYPLEGGESWIEPDTLRLCGALPREWLNDGHEIICEDLPTTFGKIFMKLVSKIQNKYLEFEFSISSTFLGSLHHIYLIVRHPDIHQRIINVNGVENYPNQEKSLVSKSFHPEIQGERIHWKLPIFLDKVEKYHFSGQIHFGI